MIHLVLSSFVADEFVAAAGSDFGSNQILIQPSVVSFVKLEKSQFGQNVVDNFADMLDKNDSEPMACNA